MSRTSMALKRLGVAALAVVTMGAVLPTLTATSAQAAHAGFTIERTSPSQTTGAGDCVFFTVTAVNADGTPAAGTPTVTVRLSETPADADTVSEVSFCGAGTTGTEVANTDPEDATAIFQTSRNNNRSTATFGVSGLTQGDVLIEAFTDNNNNGFRDANEVRATPQVQAFGPASPNTTASAAQSITLTPETSTATTGNQSDQFTAIVRDASGRIVQGATVTVTVDNGSIAGTNPAARTVTLVTNEAGQVTFRTQTPATGSGVQRVTVTLQQNGAQDTSGVVFQPAATTPPPTNTPPGCGIAAQVMLERNTITATGSSGVRVTASPNTVIELLAYTRPSTTFRVVRRAEVGADGIADFRIVPPANTRLRARQVGCAFGADKVLNVRTALSLNVTRTGTRTYRFFGDSLPARRGGLIVSLYRITANGSQILTAQTRANATNGEWVINRRFTGTGRFGFVVRTGQDLQNAPGASNVRSLLVF